MNKKERSYKVIDFSMGMYKRYPDCLYLKSVNAKLEELVKFNTARDYNQYAATLNGRLILIRSGNDMYLKIPVKKVKKYIVTFKSPNCTGIHACSVIYNTLKEAKDVFEGKRYDCLQYHEIEVEE